MNTILITLLVIITMIVCYYINKYIMKIYLKAGNIYDWSLVRTNLLMSLLIFPSILYWLAVLLYKIPNIPEEPPKWL